MSDTQDEKAGWTARLGKYKNRFLFSRGALAAISLAALVPNFFDLTRFEFLRAVHAVLAGWNIVMSALGAMIGWLPFVPDISVTVMNTLIPFFAVGPPYIIAMWGLVSKEKLLLE